MHNQRWPAPAAAGPAPAGTVALVVQVDGRVRARLPAPAGLTPAEARLRAEGLPEVARYLTGREVGRVVHVPDRLLNFVTFRR